VRKSTTPNLAPSYQTRSTYQLAEPSWFDLPPPTWNIAQPYRRSGRLKQRTLL
jgi:hypothetical protein